MKKLFEIVELKSHNDLPKETGEYHRILMDGSYSKTWYKVENQSMSRYWMESVKLYFKPVDESPEPMQGIKTKEEVLDEIYKDHPDWEDFKESANDYPLILQAMQTYASQFPTGYSREQVEEAFTAGGICGILGEDQQEAWAEYIKKLTSK